MSRFTLKSILALLLLLAAASVGAPALATAQATLRGPQASGVLPGAPSVSTSTGTTAQASVVPSEPKSMTGMLAAQNSVRTQLKLSPLTWSNDLTARAETTAKSAAEGGCSRSLAERAGETRSAGIYWAPGVRRLDGGGKPQDISPAFLVSEWKVGRADYDAVRGECRREGACEQYARMVAPAARAVGCSKAVCANRAQVWACHYSGPATPPPELRRLQGN